MRPWPRRARSPPSNRISVAGPGAGHRARTWRPSSSAARRSMRARTSSRWASCSTNSQRAGARSPARRCRCQLGDPARPAGAAREPARGAARRPRAHHRPLPGEGSRATVPDREGRAQRAGSCCAAAWSRARRRHVSTRAPPQRLRRKSLRSPCCPSSTAAATRKTSTSPTASPTSCWARWQRSAACAWRRDPRPSASRARMQRSRT